MIVLADAYAPHSIVDELVHSSKGNEAVLLKYLSGTPDPTSHTRTPENV